MKIGRYIAASDGPALVTVPNVPICATGIEYPLASGPTTFTEEDLVDAVASQEDPAIRSPRLKLGHQDPRFNNAAFDGTPAFGKAVNLRVSADQQVIIADYVGVPKWLADVMPIAYPSRSIEGGQEVETVTGHKWGLVITAVALLGVTWPGVGVLEDLPLYYGEETPPGIQIINPETGEEVEAMTVAAASAGVAANVAVEDIRREFYDQLDADQMWWWIRSMYLDPNELIVDDDDGTLYRVPFETKGDSVEFSDPVEVKIKYVDAGRGRFGRKRKERAIALVASAGREIASYETRASSRPDDSNQEEDTAMTAEQIRLLRARLNLTEEQLPDDATEDQINAALAETPGGGEEEEAGNGGEGGESGSQPGSGEEEAGKGGEGGSEAGSQPAETTAAAGSGNGNGNVTVPASEWQRVQEQAARGATAADAHDETHRRGIIEAALREGKIRPADRQSYENGLANQATRSQFETLLTAAVDKGGLAPGIVPVNERGGNATQPGDVAAGAEEYEASWLSPQERQRIEAAKSGTLQPGVVESDRKLPA